MSDYSVIWRPRKKSSSNGTFSSKLNFITDEIKSDCSPKTPKHHKKLFTSKTKTPKLKKFLDNNTERTQVAKGLQEVVNQSNQQSVESKKPGRLLIDSPKQASFPIYDDSKESSESSFGPGQFKSTDLQDDANNNVSAVDDRTQDLLENMSLSRYRRHRAEKNIKNQFDKLQRIIQAQSQGRSFVSRELSSPERTEMQDLLEKMRQSRFRRRQAEKNIKNEFDKLQRIIQELSLEKSFICGGPTLPNPKDNSNSEAENSILTFNDLSTFVSEEEFLSSTKENIIPKSTNGVRNSFPNFEQTCRIS